MTRRPTRAVLAALLVLLPFAQGCDYASFGIVISGFDQYEVQGVHLWRRNEQTGQYERGGSIVFDRVAAKWSGLRTETVAYTTTSGGIELPAEIVRDPSNPDVVTLRLAYLRVEQPGLFRASIYNRAGESPLSSAAVNL